MGKRNLVFALLLAVLLVATIPGIVPVEAQGGLTYPIALDHPYAAFLESRAYAASMGATAEFRKMEGTIIDEANMKLYMSITEVNRSMADSEGAIQLQENNCGLVYVGDLDAEYNVTELRPLVVGGPFDAATNTCNPDSIANPDNLAVDSRGRVWIGEDTGYHANNMLWVFDPASGELSRFATLPRGAEVTGLHITANGTVFMNIQHPSPRNLYPFNAGTIGVITGFNAADDFEALPLPEGDNRLVAHVAAGTYQILARVGDPIPNAALGHSFGQIIRPDGSTMFLCNDPDGNMFLPSGSSATEGHLFTNYECQPGGVSRLYIRQNADGTWNVLDGEMVDFSGINGTWNNCFASVTPWNTGLTSEEYEPFAGDPAAYDAMTDYLGHAANPYDYGWIVELVPSGASSRVERRYALGRKSNENAWVAGDQRTVYFGDDGSNVVFFKFVAEEAGDLSAGTLYAAAVTQNGENLQLEWIELGYGTDDEIEAAVRELDLAQ